MGGLGKQKGAGGFPENLVRYAVPAVYQVLRSAYRVRRELRKHGDFRGLRLEQYRNVVLFLRILRVLAVRALPGKISG